MHPKQLSLFSDSQEARWNYPFPSTRYQGSKQSLCDWIWHSICHLSFDTVLDVFGGTGAVSHLLKNAGKQVVYNDQLKFNWLIGKALIENATAILPDEMVSLILRRQDGINYPDFIEKTFPEIYFTDEENRWLDQTIYHITHWIDNPYQQAIAWFALFQACIAKRPYNLFHRANLYMRTAEVKRSFGNKTTWDTPFEAHFRAFVAEANRAVFDNERQNQAIQMDALATPTGFDLVYIDPPYLNQKGVGVDYRDFYHFLEGMVDYDTWATRIDYPSKHHRLKPEKSVWNRTDSILPAFERLIAHHQHSILVISYRDNGIPSKEQLLGLLQRYKKQVYEASRDKQYVLSNQKSQELLLIGI